MEDGGEEKAGSRARAEARAGARARARARVETHSEVTIKRDTYIAVILF